MSDLLTVIPDTREALLGLLRGRPALDGVQVARSHPGKDRVAARAIWLGEVENADQEAAALGARKRREEFIQALVVSVEYPGNDMDATEGETWPLVRDIAQAIRDDYTLGGVLDIAEVVPISFDHYPGDGKRVAECVLGIRCKALRV